VTGSQSDGGAHDDRLRERVRRRLLLAMAAGLERFDLGNPAVEETCHAVRVRDLPEALVGLTIAQVSDLHVGPGRWQPRRWREAALLVGRSAPSFVVNTGDFLQWEPDPDRAREIFSAFMASASDQGDARTFAILGNHDYYAGLDMVHRLNAQLDSIDVTVLTNLTTSVVCNGARLSITGLTTQEPGFEDAIEALLAADRPRIVLIHEPDLSGWLPARSADLILAGHTHGGQATLPFLERFIVRTFARSHFVEGWYTVNDNPMYVNRGLGFTGYPFRLRARPEVSIFRLTH
jgi:predicted MPP superfamily phosphohydrolase